MTLHDTILAYSKQLEGNLSFYLLDLQNQFEINIHSNARMHAASLIKVPLLIDAFFQLETNQLSLEEVLPLKAAEKVGGCGVLPLLHDDSSLTIEDYLNLMICVSDNTATNMLIDYLGIDHVNKTLDTLGLKDTLLARKLMITGSPIYSYTTAKDMGQLLKILKEPSLLSDQSKAKALSILSNQQFNDRLSNELYLCGHCHALIGFSTKCPICNTSASSTDSIPVVFPHKTGEIVSVVHDAGIMTLFNHDVVVVAMTNHLTNNLDGHKLLSEIGKSIYNYYADNYAAT